MKEIQGSGRRHDGGGETNGKVNGRGSSPSLAAYALVKNKNVSAANWHRVLIGWKRFKREGR